MPKGELIDRAFTIIGMFETGPVTARMIQERFNISRVAANRWIMQASRFMPIIEDGVVESNGGRRGMSYRLMNESD